jgi:serine/threonine protein kinase
VGTFGKLKLARRKKDGKVFCVKIMMKSKIIQAKQVDHITNEVEILKYLNHTMIVKSL